MPPSEQPQPSGLSSIPTVSSSHPYPDDIAADPTKSSLVASLFGDDDGDEDENMEEDENPYRDLPLEEVLDDLNTRFLINLPQSEWRAERLYWQTEQAHWFYEDFVRPVNPHLPTMSQKTFTERIIQQSPLFPFISQVFPQPINWDMLWAEHMMYRKMVPCCGAIILNEQLTKGLVVQGMKSTGGWCFPRGKINGAEAEEACAIREVEEETGFDISKRIRSEDKIQTFINAQVVTMFIIPGVPENTVFEPQTRNEIGAIQWVKLKELPTWTGRQLSKTETKGKRFFNVTPFIGPLKRWVNAKKSSSVSNVPQAASQESTPSIQKGMRALQPYNMDDGTASPVSTPYKAPNKRPLQHAGNSSEEENIQSSERFAGVGHGGFSPAVDSSRLAALFQGLAAEPTGQATGGTAGTTSGPGGNALPAHQAPAGEVPRGHSKDRVAALLALLGGGPAPAAASSPPVQSQVGYGQPPYHQATSPASPSPARGHQASMLAMLSPPPPPQAATPSQSAPLAMYDTSRSTTQAASSSVQVPPGAAPARHASVVAMLKDFGYPASAAPLFLSKGGEALPARSEVSPAPYNNGPAVPGREWQPIGSAVDPTRSTPALTTGPPPATHSDMLANAFARLIPPAPVQQPPPAGPRPVGYPLAYGQSQPQYGQPGQAAPHPGFPVYGQQQQPSGSLPPSQAPQYPGYAFQPPHHQQGFGQR